MPGSRPTPPVVPPTLLHHPLVPPLSVPQVGAAAPYLHPQTLITNGVPPAAPTVPYEASLADEVSPYATMLGGTGAPPMPAAATGPPTFAQPAVLPIPAPGSAPTDMPVQSHPAVNLAQLASLARAQAAVDAHPAALAKGGPPITSDDLHAMANLMRAHASRLAAMGG
jgi:hypothetical protein